MNSLISYTNHVNAASIQSVSGNWQSLLNDSTALANLITPQLSDVLVIRATSNGPFAAFNNRSVRHAAVLMWQSGSTPPLPLLPVGLLGAMALNASTNLGPIADGDLVAYWAVTGSSAVPVFLGSLSPVWPAQFPRNLWAALGSDTDLHTVSLIVLHLGTTGAHMDLQLGGLWVGPSFRPEAGLRSAWTLDIIPGAETGDPEAAVSRGGQAFFSLPTNRRRFAGQWAALSTAEALGSGTSAPDWQALLASTRGRPVVMLPRLRAGTDMSASLDPQIMLRLGVYGYLQAGGGLLAQVGPKWGTRTFTIDEML